MSDDLHLFTEDGTGPRCYMAEDGEHFWFDHKCADPTEALREKERQGAKIAWNTVPAYIKGRNHTMLPVGPEGWTVVSKEPLTVSPSILCGECGLHGFWREGKWVGA